MVDMPVLALLGGPAQWVAPALPDLSCDSPEDVAFQIRNRGAPHKMFQCKLGIGAIADDLKRPRVA
ncbi:MAG: hypothetical protein AB8B85_10925 [Paracoccaceae bacterium]